MPWWQPDLRGLASTASAAPQRSLYIHCSASYANRGRSAGRRALSLPSMGHVP